MFGIVYVLTLIGLLALSKFIIQEIKMIRKTLVEEDGDTITYTFVLMLLAFSVVAPVCNVALLMYFFLRYLISKNII